MKSAVFLRATVDLSAIGIIAQLTPLLVSNPNDSFDPADPWFKYLDPSRQGLAFSRRYGFDMDVMTDYLPWNRALWIRNLGSSPELSFYDYNDFVGALTWNPILGTDGTSHAVSAISHCFCKTFIIVNVFRVMSTFAF